MGATESVACSSRDWVGGLQPGRAGAIRRRQRCQRVVAAWPSLRQHTEGNRLFVFGLGYTGLGAASYFMKRGWAVAGTCRSQEKRQLLEQRGITAFYFDPSEFDNLSGKALESMRGATHVLSTVPPDAGGGEQDPVILAHSQQLSEQGERYQWAGYISSTSVYGDYGEEWVDEGSELRAAGGKGWARVVAEHEWLALHDSFGLPLHIFRCGGIYGPKRSALETVQRQWAPASGELAAAPRQWRPSASQERRALQRHTARCHVYDICQALEASMRRPHPGAAYNVVDDDPSDRATVMQFAAELLERRAAGLPVQGDWALGGGWSWHGGVGGGGAASDGAARGAGPGSYDSSDEAAAAWWLLGRRSESPGRGRSRRDDRAAAATAARLEEKRVRNGRLKQELGVTLRFPTYREGLAAIAGGDVRPFD